MNQASYRVHAAMPINLFRMQDPWVHVVGPMASLDEICAAKYTAARQGILPAAGVLLR